jgi:S-DNA-T family DNA segregation ATPase FtsK/SpoIIIE
MELPNGKGGKKKAASKQRLTVSPMAPAPEGGSLVEGEMAGELLAVPGPSGMRAGSSGSMPPVPAGESAAAATPAAGELTAVEPVATELPPAILARESGEVRPEVPTAELLGVRLSEPAAQAAAAAPAAEAVTVARLVSEALFALELDLGAEVLTGVPAAVESAAAVAASATESAAVERERPVLTDGPAAASREYWVLNAAVEPRVILKKALGEPAAMAAETAAAGAEWAGESVPGLGELPAARRAACETTDSPVVTASEPRLPMAAAASVKRKAKAGVTEGSQKRKKSSPVEAKDL